MLKKYLLLPLLLSLSVCPAGISLAQNMDTTNLFTRFLREATNLKPHLLNLGLTAYHRARAQGLVQQPMLTIIDYSKPSNQRRFWVLDVNRGHVLFNTLVAHGKNSGRLYAQSFSNRIDSYQSSIGTMITGNAYFGKNGYSLRLEGLEPGFNDNVARRNIVIHGAKYVNQSFARQTGHLGRTLGCFGLAEALAPKIIDTIKQGSLVFSYYPSRKWLEASEFVNDIA